MNGLFPGLGQYLALLGHGAWSPDEPYPDGATAIVLGTLPAAPDRCIALSPYPGGVPAQGSSNEPEDTEPVEILVRGDTDYLGSHDAAAAIYRDLNGQSTITLPNGCRVSNIVALQTGARWMGTDNGNRHRHSVVVEIEYLNPTRLRPLPGT